MPDLIEFSKKFSIPIITIEEMIKYRVNSDSLVEMVAEAKLREHPHWPAVTVSQVSGIPVPLVEAIRARLVAAGELTADGDWFAEAAARGPKNAAEERKMAAEIERRKARLRELRDGPSVEI